MTTDEALEPLRKIVAWHARTGGFLRDTVDLEASEAILKLVEQLQHDRELLLGKLQQIDDALDAAEYAPAVEVVFSLINQAKRDLSVPGQ